ncbi:MAG: AbrB/MazE/SpoVT family DNA-binding domain-containing protein [Verrucomicrobia bacterium]|nr:MAG: AbrB/MazE/SpoVT family DNA-binding domain-containing protein [Verrucomicrobiota bacterium]
MMITTLTGKNQITIPAALSAKLKLKRGTRLEWMATNAPDEIHCRILPDPAVLASELHGAGRRYLQAGKKHPPAALLEERGAEDGGRKGPR